MCTNTNNNFWPTRYECKVEINEGNISVVFGTVQPYSLFYVNMLLFPTILTRNSIDERYYLHKISDMSLQRDVIIFAHEMRLITEGLNIATIEMNIYYTTIVGYLD